MERITVYVNDEPYGLMTGAEVWMVLERLPFETRLAIETGQAYLADGYGNELGTGGGLADGQRLFVVYSA